MGWGISQAFWKRKVEYVTEHLEELEEVKRNESEDELTVDYAFKDVTGAPLW